MDKSQFFLPFSNSQFYCNTFEYCSKHFSLVMKLKWKTKKRRQKDVRRKRLGVVMAVFTLNQKPLMEKLLAVRCGAKETLPLAIEGRWKKQLVSKM